MDNAPNLIENSLKFHLYNTLSKCHLNRTNIYHIILNLSVFILFLGIFGITLFYCYKKKPSPRESYEKLLKDQEYVLSKIRFYQEQAQKSKTTLITDLPL